MTDIKSGSEKVKKIFSVTEENRTTEFLSKITLSNDEILEVYELSREEEVANKNRTNMIRLLFLKRLINSQKGPFNEEVVKACIVIMRELGVSGFNMFFSVIMKADKSINENTKYKWLMDTHKYERTTLYQFVRDGEAVNFDFTKEPWKRVYILYTFNYGHPNDYAKELHPYLNKMTEDELFDFYMRAQEIGVDNDKNFKFWFNYSRTPNKIFKQIIEQATNNSFGINVREMVKHPNCPPEIKMEMFKKTGDISLLPEEIQAIFVFE